MDTSYAMAKFRLESKDILKSKQKGCWHYMKYFFIFSSIIQFLIILGLVLFMLYGNAHGGTELRLKSVENRYNNLTLDHAWLKGNFSMVKAKLAGAEKDLKNCSDNAIRMRLHIASLNRTCTAIPGSDRFRIQMPTCNHLQAVLDRVNMTCIHERLKAENYKMSQQLAFNQYRENCTKTVTEYASNDHVLSSTNVQLLKDKRDLGTQIKLLQESCTTIDADFKDELHNLKKFIEGNVNPVDQYSYSAGRCKTITDTINNRIDFTLNKLRQDVTNVATQNAQLKATLDRTTEDSGICKQTKDLVTIERNKIAAEKTALEKELGEKKDELNKSYARYIKKEEELEICRRPQIIRPAMFPPTRT